MPKREHGRTNRLLQQWIWLEELRTNWRAIQSRLTPASPACLRQLAAIALRLRAARSPDEFAAILHDLLDLIAATEAAEYVRGLLARSTIPETPLPPASEYTQHNSAPSGPLGRATVERLLPAEAAALPEPAMAETGVALAADIAEPKDAIGVRLFFASNREASSSQKPGEQFGYGRTSRPVFGQISVSIPVTHRKGHLEKPGFFEHGKTHKHFAVGRDLELLEIDAFRARLERQLASDASRELLVFVHGFNVSFEDALLRAAQLKYDLNFHGEIVLFTWPSRGSLFAYSADLDTAQYSGTPLAEFLAAIAQGPWGRVHLLAHSMGGRVSLGGLVDPAAPEKGLGQVVLVAADVASDFFAQQFPRLSCKSEGRTSYVASKDRALWFSGKLVNLSGRIGYLDKEPFVIGGMETVDASPVDRGFLAHSYFSDIRAVLDDLGYLLGHHLPAGQRPNLREKRLASGEMYWQFPP